MAWPKVICSDTLLKPVFLPNNTELLIYFVFQKQMAISFMSPWLVGSARPGLGSACTVGWAGGLWSSVSSFALVTPAPGCCTTQ